MRLEGTGDKATQERLVYTQQAVNSHTTHTTSRGRGRLGEETHTGVGEGGSYLLVHSPGVSDSQGSSWERGTQFRFSTWVTGPSRLSHYWCVLGSAL